MTTLADTFKRGSSPESTLTNPFTLLLDTLGRSRQRQYWTLQCIGWSGYLFFLEAQAWATDGGDPVHTLYAVVSTLTGLLLSVGMHRVFKDT